MILGTGSISQAVFSCSLGRRGKWLRVFMRRGLPVYVGGTLPGARGRPSFWSAVRLCDRSCGLCPPAASWVMSLCTFDHFSFPVSWSWNTGWRGATSVSWGGVALLVNRETRQWGLLQEVQPVQLPQRDPPESSFRGFGQLDWRLALCCCNGRQPNNLFILASSPKQLAHPIASYLLPRIPFCLYHIDRTCLVSIAWLRVSKRTDLSAALCHNLHCEFLPFFKGGHMFNL